MDREVRKAGSAAYNSVLFWGLGLLAAGTVVGLVLGLARLAANNGSGRRSAAPPIQPSLPSPFNAPPPAPNMPPADPPRQPFPAPLPNARPPFAADPRQSEPLPWRVEEGGNGHYYEFVPGKLSWTEAKRQAEARTFQGVHGHLATITSEQESAFLRRTLPGRRGWIGGFQDKRAPNYAEPAGGWRWVTGEVWNYTNWARSEPNNFGRGEDFALIDALVPGPDSWKWNDVAEDSFLNQGYYVEYPIATGAKDK